MQSLTALVARVVDALVARHGMALLYHPMERMRFAAWHDSRGALTVELGRFEVVRDRGMPLARRMIG
jgi:hypothetical protein